VVFKAARMDSESSGDNVSSDESEGGRGNANARE